MVTAVIVGEVEVVHLAWQITSCIVFMTAQRGNINFSCVSIHVDEQADGHMAFEATRLIWFPMACTNEGPLQSSEGGLGRRRNFEED